MKTAPEGRVASVIRTVVAVSVVFVASTGLWMVAIGWAQRGVSSLLGRPLVEPPDDWHWISLLALLTLIPLTTAFAARLCVRK
jgi:hypothetical protein